MMRMRDFRDFVVFVVVLVGLMGAAYLLSFAYVTYAEGDAENSVTAATTDQSEKPHPTTYKVPHDDDVSTHCSHGKRVWTTRSGGIAVTEDDECKEEAR